MAQRNYNLKQFRTGLTSVARSQYFYVDMGDTIGDSTATTALARSTTLPAITHGVIDVPFRGLNMRITDRPEFPEWTVTYLCTEDHNLRNSHIAWMNKQYNVTGLENRKHSNYKVDDVKLFHLTSTHTDAFGYRFYGMFPSAVGEMSVAQEGGEVLQFDVTYSYDFFLTAPGEGVNGLAGIDFEDQASGIAAAIDSGLEAFKGFIKKASDILG